MRPAIESDAYEYVAIYLYWGTKEIFTFRLYNTYTRAVDRLSPYLEDENITLGKLTEMKKLVDEEVVKLKKRIKK
jgi:hypothetical protein